MEKLLSMELRIFLMMAVGFVIRQLKVVGKEAERVITDLVLYVVLPCNIFISFLGDNTGVGVSDYLTVLLISIGIQLLHGCRQLLQLAAAHPHKTIFCNHKETI